MDAEEERVLYLSRVGRDKIFKYGTYTMVQERAITQQDHPFYVKREDHLEKISAPNPAAMQEQAAPAQAAPEPAVTEAAAAAPPPPPPPPPSEDDAAALAAQMISSNFKVGLSQDEVDALLNGMV